MSTKIFFLKVPGEVFYLDGCYITQENFEQEIGTTGKLNYSDGCYITQERIRTWNLVQQEIEFEIRLLERNHSNRII